jgi:hypothetical protein
MKRVLSLRAGALPSYRYGEEIYDPNKLGLGDLMVQRNGADVNDKWVGPIEHKVIRYFDNLAIAMGFPWAMQWVDTPTQKLDWIFMADLSTAAATRRVIAFTFNRLTGAFAYVGFVTLTFPAATNHTIRAMRMSYDLYTAGTVAVSGTAVTGSGSDWVTSRLASGCRIGFGSTNPAEIATWFQISAIGSNTGITLTSSAGTIAAGTPYVIEDLRAVVVTTNATATNGGVFLAKGLSFEAFSNLGTTIPAATTVDNIRAVYWLKDAATVLQTASNGCGITPKVSWTEQVLWAGNGTTTQQLFKHNLRAALTLTAGASTSAFLFATAASAALTGTIAQNNNGRLATVGHGPGAGLSSYYFSTGSRVYRCKSVDSITTGDTTHISGGNVMVPIWPANNATFGVSPTGLQGPEYAGNIDRFIIPNVATNQVRAYVSQFRSDSSPMDRVMGVETNTSAGSPADTSMYPLAKTIGGTGCWAEKGILYTAIGSAVGDAVLSAAPIGADWEFTGTTGAVVIFPRMAFSGEQQLRRIMTSSVNLLGGASGYNLGLPPEPYRLSYRTSGISDDSGTWTPLDQLGSIAASTTEVQVRAEFRAMGLTIGLCSRLLEVAAVYEDNTTDDHYAFDGSKSSATSKQFAFWHATAFGSTVPPLRVRIYDADTQALLVDDTTAAPTGIWERTTDGANWSPWTNADRANSTTWIRYTPASIADNVKARVHLTVE